MVDLSAAKKKLEEAQAEYEKAITTERDKLLKQRDEIDVKLAELGGARTQKAGGVRRAGVKDIVLALVKKHGKLTKGDIVAGLHAKDDPSYVTSISAALATMKKDGSLMQENRGDPYSIPVSQ